MRFILTVATLVLPLRSALASPTPWYTDEDGDGYGTWLVTVSESAPAGTTAARGDCDDAMADIHPGADETCDGLDNNCDGRRDEEEVCRLSGVVGADEEWDAGTLVSSLAAADPNHDGRDEAVIVGEDEFGGSWAGGAQLLDHDGLNDLVSGARSGDAMGYFPAIAVGGLTLIGSPNADLGGIDSGAFYTVLGSTRGAAVYGNGRSRSSSDYNGDLADAGSGAVLVGFPSTGGADAGAAYVVTASAALAGGRVDRIASLSLTPSTSGRKLGRRVGSLHMDGDGDPELLVADTSAIHVVPGGLTGSSAITSVETSQLTYTSVSWLGSADADGDGREDLAIVAGNALYVLDPDDVLAGLETPFATATGVAEVAFGDLDGDGQEDLAWVDTGGTLSLAYGPFAGTITADASGAESGVSHVAIADIDVDGALDVVFSTDEDLIYAIHGE